jgi:hypothetical protein
MAPNMLGDIYTGSYSVTPSFEEQTLNTRYKQLEDNIVVVPIPIFRTSNNSGGITVYIANEV